MTSRLARVPVDDAPCFWCGQRVGHDPRCNVAHLLPAPAAAPLLTGFTHTNKRYPLERPTSRDEFAAAQRAGETVGHEWNRKHDPS